MKKTILFVDDDAKRISSYVEYLDHSGYTTIVESDSTRVLSIFNEKQNEIDLIILDMMMPTEHHLKDETDYGRRTGLYLLKKIREISKDIAIMVLTVVRDSSVREITEKLGGSPYLEKPIMPSRLVEEIEKKLAEPKGERK